MSQTATAAPALPGDGRRQRARRVAAGLAVAVAAWQLCGAGYIHAKAALAQVLLEQAWQQSRAGGQAVKPWPWADTTPVARLSLVRLGIAQIVLSGDSGRSLAFGPGWVEASARPGEVGNSIVSAHRDTHFSFLREVEIGDRVWIETRDGRFAYEIEGAEVVDVQTSSLPLGGDQPLLSLVTCYPFDALNAHGPLRYVVSARLVASAAGVD